MVFKFLANFLLIVILSNLFIPSAEGQVRDKADRFERARVLNLDKLRLATYPVLSLMRPLRIESVYDRPISLQEALEYVTRNNLPIKISHESAIFQDQQLMAQLAGFVPNFTMNWALSRATINHRTTANSRVYQTIIRYPIFQGGSVVYGSLSQYYRDTAWRQAYATTINDTLLDVYTKYTNLVLNRALMHIAAKSQEVSEAQLELNNDLYRSGVGTRFAIMQSRTQLAVDRQALLQQRINTRQAALNLAFALNLPMSINLIPLEESIAEQSLIDQKLKVSDFLEIAYKHNPQLRQYEFFDLTAARIVQAVAAALYPQVGFFTGYTHSSTTVGPIGNGRDLNGVASASISANGNSVGTVSNTALGQSAFFSPISSMTANTGAKTGATPIVASSGGNPLSTVQSGSLVTSGAVAPAFGSGNGLNGLGAAVNLSGGNTVGAGIFGGLSNTFQQGFNMTYTLPNLGVDTAATIVAIRALSREALLQANQAILLSDQLVRQDYLSMKLAGEQIDTAIYGVDSSGEALRIAELRVKTGTGTNLELIQAQRDYINALVTQAQAIITSNQAQAQLLHDTGVISVNTLLDGYTTK